MPQNYNSHRKLTGEDFLHWKKNENGAFLDATLCQIGISSVWREYPQ